MLSNNCLYYGKRAGGDSTSIYTDSNSKSANSYSKIIGSNPREVVVPSPDSSPHHDKKQKFETTKYIDLTTIE